MIPNVGGSTPTSKRSAAKVSRIAPSSVVVTGVTISPSTKRSSSVSDSSRAKPEAMKPSSRAEVLLTRGGMGDPLLPSIPE